MPSWRLRAPQHLLYWTNPELNFNLDEPTPTQRSYLGTHVYSSLYCNRISLDKLSSNFKILKVIPDFKKLIVYESLTNLRKKNVP